MNISPSITTNTDITLITLQNCPSKLKFIANVFQKIGSLGIDVDMISLAPSHSEYTSVSFTIADIDFDKVYSFTSELREKANIRANVSSGNCKISVYSPEIKNYPGVAAEVFQAVAATDTDIRIITTSEVDISILVTAAEFNDALNSLESRLNTKAK